MAAAADLRRLALDLPGTEEYPHFDRRAFKARVTYVTLAADGLTANFKFSPGDQELKCTVAREVFAPVSGGWGRMGWTTAVLAKLSLAELEAALKLAWAAAVAKPSKPRKRN